MIPFISNDIINFLEKLFTGSYQKTSKNSLVSIIVPNYNHENFLRKRLDSIYNQSYKNFEVILLDDKSSDGSVTVLEEYAHRYSNITTLVINKINSGGFSSMETY